MLEFAYLALSLIVALLFVAITILINYKLAPVTEKTELKLSTYECGEELIGEAHIRMSVKYYIYGIAYLITDILAIFIIIWSLTSVNLGTLGIFSIIFFSLIALLGLGYVIKKGLLKWV